MWESLNNKRFVKKSKKKNLSSEEKNKIISTYKTLGNIQATCKATKHGYKVVRETLEGIVKPSNTDKRIPIVRIHPETGEVKKFPSIWQAAKGTLGVTAPEIYHCAVSKKNKSACGYFWVCEKDYEKWERPQKFLYKELCYREKILQII